MADLRQVTDTFAVAPQLEPADLAELKAAGFRRVIGNRPDNEAPPGARADDIRKAAEAIGLTYVHAPFVGAPTPEAVEAAANASERTVAYCRSGTRSVTAWALSQAQKGSMSADDIVEAAGNAGYNLAALKDALRQLGAR
ncbi:MAG TPA: TIGR01244 family sulfur transferase [Hyphomonadaceae bacterium]|nr:TIGR01244 family sulfur transferase [Hyphomonadaceae bacterium]